MYLENNQFMDYEIRRELYHHGIKGQKWGVRRYQNDDGSLTSLGRKRLGYSNGEKQSNEPSTLSRRQRIKNVKSEYRSNGYAIADRFQKENDRIYAKYNIPTNNRAEKRDQIKARNSEIDKALGKFQSEYKENNAKYKQQLKEAKKFTPEEKKKALKIAAGVAAGALAAYGAVKLTQAVSDKQYRKYSQKAEKLLFEHSTWHGRSEYAKVSADNAPSFKLNMLMNEKADNYQNRANESFDRAMRAHEKAQKYLKTASKKTKINAEITRRARAGKL